MKKYFQKSAIIALILVYLVIFAGAFVRLTGSGMGCPDWPKCFGYYIPPTHESELLFTAGKKYEKGQVIIKDETLLVAKTNFIANSTFENSNWEKYTKHNYAIFNPLHTWVEYINRLFGALAGIACFVTFLFSFGFWKENKKLILITFFVCILMGFQAWLGKTVVDSVLNPIKITTHMLVALLIVALQLITIFSFQKNKIRLSVNSRYNWVLIISFAFTIIQITVGTSVREQVDNMVATGAPEIFWLKNPNLSFYIHRSFSIIVFFVNLYLYVQNKKLRLGINKINWVMILLFIEIVSGIAMFYFNFPFGTQTIHIVIATLLFGCQFYIIIESIKIQLLPTRK